MGREKSQANLLTFRNSLELNTMDTYRKNLYFVRTLKKRENIQAMCFRKECFCFEKCNHTHKWEGFLFLFFISESWGVFDISL